MPPTKPIKLPDYTQSAWQQPTITAFAHKWAQQALITTPKPHRLFPKNSQPNPMAARTD